MALTGIITKPLLRGTVTAAGPWQALFAQPRNRVYPFSRGCAVRADSVGTTVDTSGLGEFHAGDYLMVCRPTYYGDSFLYVPLVTAISRVSSVGTSDDELVLTQALTVYQGDWLLNLGSDTASAPLSAPNYDGSRVALYSDPAGLATLGSDYFLTGQGGFFQGWASQVLVDLMITDASGAPILLIPTFQAIAVPNTNTYNVLDFGAAGDGVADDTAALQAALAAAYNYGELAPEAGGGIVILPPGTYLISDQLVVRNRVMVRGSGGWATSIIKADPSFPINTALVRLGMGPPESDYATRLEDLRIDCNGVDGSIGVYSNTANEFTGVYRCTIRAFKYRGIQVEYSGVPSSAQQWSIKDIIILFHEDCDATAIGIDLQGSGNVFHDMQGLSISVSPALANVPTTGIRMRSCYGLICNIHAEGVQIPLDLETGCAGTTVMGLKFSDNSTVPAETLVRIGNAATNVNIAIHGLRPGNSTNLIVDNLNGTTITSAANATFGMYHTSALDAYEGLRIGRGVSEDISITFRDGTGRAISWVAGSTAFEVSHNLYGRGNLFWDGRVRHNLALTTLTVNSGTPDVSAASSFQTLNTVATTITALVGGAVGQEIVVFINDEHTTIDFSGTTLKGNGGLDWKPRLGDVLLARHNGTNWHCWILDTEDDQPVFNVRNFGARGDSVTDDATEIQTAIDLAGVRGGIVYFPPGTHRVITPLTISNPRVVIAGPGKIYGALSSGQSLFTITGNDCSVKDVSLLLDANVKGIAIQEAKDVRIVDVQIDGQNGAGTVGVYLRNSNYAWVERCTVRDCVKAIHIDSQSGTAQNTHNIIGNHLYIGHTSSDTAGLASSIGIDVDTTDNLILDNTIYGFVRGITINGTSNVIQGNHIYKGYPTSNVLLYCLDIVSNNTTIVGNYFDNADTAHIRLEDPFTEQIIGNQFLFGSGNSVPGVLLAFNANAFFSQLTIKGNHFRYIDSYSDQVIDLGASTEWSHANTAGVYISENTFQGYTGTSSIQGNNGADDLGESFICPQTTHAIRTISGATPNVKGATVVTTNNGGSTTVTALGGGLPGQVVTVIIGDNNTDFQHGTGLKLKGGGDWLNSGSGDTITFAFDGTNWREVSRNAQSAVVAEIINAVNVTGNDAIVTFGRFFINLTNVSGTNTITLNAPDASADGKLLVLRCAALTAGTVTLADSGNASLSAAWAPDANDTLVLIARSTVWYELARSAN